MKDYKPKNNRKSIRLQSYDYSNPGYYFVTICTKDREAIFGNIENGMMAKNELGNVAYKYWLRMPIQYDYVRIPAFVIMPNHVHGIIEVTQKHTPTVGAIHELPLRLGIIDHETYRKERRQMYLSKIVGWYKMNVSKEINNRFGLNGSSCWQRNYYEHIIRNQKSLNKITEYIEKNPQLWEKDKYFNKSRRGNS
ncbi:transposase [Gracilimonas tropica]|uniref:transposase n=1 Tax=Gracilimonas tropica TaxID=454600 RepID=UPI0003669A26|nr:transposase [Gracilimonas tropica]